MVEVEEIDVPVFEVYWITRVVDVVASPYSESYAG